MHTGTLEKPLCMASLSSCHQQGLLTRVSALSCCQTFDSYNYKVFVHHCQIPPPTTTLLSANPLSYFTLSKFMLSDPMLSDLLRGF